MIEVLNGRPHLRPCRDIPAERHEGQDWAPVPIAQIYEAVTRWLPLAGADAVTPRQLGDEPRLVAALRDEAPWMAAAIDHMAEQIAISSWAGRPWLRLRPMLLCGPPGAGKSYFARRVGDLASCGSTVLSLGGLTSNSELAGNPRGYKHPQPCLPVRAMQRSKVANPMIVLDEVEKAAEYAGSNSGTLLSLLEPGSAKRHFDGCLDAEVNLAQVNWLLTCNAVDRLPAPLLSRVDVVEVDGPGPEHAELLLTMLLRAAARDAGLSPAAMPPLEPAAERMLLDLFRRTRSVRRLRRAIDAVLAVSARQATRTLN